MKEWIEFIKIIFIISLVFCLCDNNIANAITLDEQIKIKSELELICTSYKTTCNVRYTDSYIPQAYTTYHGNIVLSSGLTNYLSYNEIRAVGLHEVGHRVLNHYQKQDKFLKNWNFDRNELKNFRYNNEFTADLFATLYYKQTKQKNYLPEALLKLTAPDKINISTSSHPSTRIRIEKINQIEKGNLLK